jgi:endonuclease YncB( thermonuclease family)
VSSKFSRSRLRRLGSVSFAAAFLVSFPLAANAECTGEDAGSSLVTEIRGGDTLILQDGRSVRLAGVLLPRRGGNGDVAAAAREAAERTLADLILNQVVELRLDERRRDRYGRVLAELFVSKDGQQVWVQERLIASGVAEVMSSKDNRRCIAELLNVENVARESKQGQWGTGLFSIQSASAEDILADLAQSYEIVEGRVENVAEVGNRIYLNFGKNWRRDFTIAIPKEAARLFDGDRETLMGLKGRSVRVRGWIENLNGPSISLSHPEQMEILTGAVTSSVKAP